MSSHQAAVPSADTRRIVTQAGQRPSAADATLAATAKIAARIAGALTLAGLAVGAAVHITAAAPASRLLGFHFAGLPARPRSPCDGAGR